MLAVRLKIQQKLDKSNLWKMQHLTVILFSWNFFNPKVNKPFEIDTRIHAPCLFIAVCFSKKCKKYYFVVLKISFSKILVEYRTMEVLFFGRLELVTLVMGAASL